MAEYALSIITPQGKSYAGNVEFVSVPGSEGSLGVLSNHAPMVSGLKSGVVKIQEQSAEKFFAIKSGLLEVLDSGEVLLLCDQALPADTSADAKEVVKSFGAEL